MRFFTGLLAAAAIAGTALGRPYKRDYTVGALTPEQDVATPTVNELAPRQDLPPIEGASEDTASDPSTPVVEASGSPTPDSSTPAAEAASASATATTVTLAEGSVTLSADPNAAAASDSPSAAANAASVTPASAAASPTDAASAAAATPTSAAADAASSAAAPSFSAAASAPAKASGGLPLLGGVLGDLPIPVIRKRDSEQAATPSLSAAASAPTSVTSVLPSASSAGASGGLPLLGGILGDLPIPVVRKRDPGLLNIISVVPGVDASSVPEATGTPA